MAVNVNLKLEPVAKPRAIKLVAEVTFGTVANNVVPSLLYSFNKWLTAFGEAVKEGRKSLAVVVDAVMLVGIASVEPARVETEIFALAADEVKKTPFPIAIKSIL